MTMNAEFEPLVAAREATGYHLRAIRGDHESLTLRCTSIMDSMNTARQLEAEGWWARIDYPYQNQWQLFFVSIPLAVHLRAQN